MRIKRLELKNFRGFEELTINFPEAPNNVAVFVGVNGAGKTSVLEAIVNIIQKFFDSMFEVKYSHEFTEFQKHRNAKNIRKEYNEAEIVAEIINEILGIFKVDLKILKIGQTKIDSPQEGKIINSTWDDARNPREKFKKNTPISFFYPTDRFVKDNPNLNPINLGNIQPADAFRQALSREIDFDAFFQWFRSIEDSENEQIRFTDNSKFRSKELEAVRKAINIFLPNFKNPRVQRQPQEELIVEKNGEKLSISNLSHGERLMFAMVGDIARRLSIANPDLDDPLQGEGVVLIDEIELHLHPGWQRKIVPLLTNTFPNIQFIITTHSPVVLSTVKRENIFILEDFKLVEKTPHTYGRDINSILYQTFGVEERQPEVENEFRKLYALIDDPERVEEAKATLEKMKEKYGADDPELIRADMHLEFLTN
ncbi:MAG: AAA family ATPase [Saprospiraceae bacterium]